MTLADIQSEHEISIAISLVAGLAISIVHALKMRRFQRSGRRRESSYPDHRPAILGPYIFIVAPVTLFCLLLPIDILITALRSGISLDELPSIPLLLCSLIVGAIGILRVLLAVFHRQFKWIRDRLCNQQLEDSNLSEHVLAEALEVSFIGQYGFYGIIVSLLWVFELTGETDPLLFAIQLVLLFVIDDWNIIAGYVSLTRGRVRKIDKYRIIVTNVLLAGLMAVVAIRTYPTGTAGLVLVGLALSLFFAASYWLGMTKNYPDLRKK